MGGLETDTWCRIPHQKLIGKRQIKNPDQGEQCAKTLIRRAQAGGIDWESPSQSFCFDFFFPSADACLSILLTWAYSNSPNRFHSGVLAMQIIRFPGDCDGGMETLSSGGKIID